MSGARVHVGVALVPPASSFDDDGLLTPGERARAAAMGNAGRRAAYMAGRRALRLLLRRHLPAAAEVETVTRPCPVCGRATGKPALPEPGVAVSVSHADGLVAVALSDVEVGIDVQGRDSAHAERLARSWFAPAEHDALVAGTVCFRRLWARKEAMGKALGVGIAHGVLRTDVLGPQASLPPFSLWLEDVSVGAGAACALATLGAPAEVSVDWLDVVAPIPAAVARAGADPCQVGGRHGDLAT